MTVLLVPSATWGYGALMACRFLIGVSHGMMWPAISAIFVKWAPPFEKSRIIGFSSSGSNIGNVVALPLGGFLCNLDNCWKTMFYIFGFSGVVWFFLFLLLTADSPNEHKFISQREKTFVINHTETNLAALSEQEPINKTGKPEPVPWLAIFKSKACIAIFVAHLCNNWGNYLFLTQLPSFMKDILRFDIKSNGLYSSIPYISSWICALVSSYISDRLIINQTCSKSTIRKIFNGLGIFFKSQKLIYFIFLTFLMLFDF